MATYNLTAEKRILVLGDTYSYCPKLVCIGWVKDISVSDGNEIIPLAVANMSDIVRGVDDSIGFEILRSGNDYRLQFFNSQSSLIDKTLNIKINDGNWHMLSYECQTNGVMSYTVDGKYIAPRTGSNTSGLSYSVAQTKYARVGGGKTWSPYLYASEQAIKMFRWRVAKGINIGTPWINKLMNVDKSTLGID